MFYTLMRMSLVRNAKRPLWLAAVGDLLAVRFAKRFGYVPFKSGFDTLAVAAFFAAFVTSYWPIERLINIANDHFIGIKRVDFAHEIFLWHDEHKDKVDNDSCSAGE